MLSINLTTTHERLHLCANAVWSLVHQTYPFDQIRLWISKEPYLLDQGIQVEPAWIDELSNLGFNIKLNWVDNTGPYRKIIPALRTAAENDILVTADDDICYGPYWLENLVSQFVKTDQKNVVACRVYKTEPNTSYLNLHLIREDCNLKDQYIATWGGGVILKKGHILPELLILEDYLRICPTGDDIWLTKLLQLSDVTLTVAPAGLQSLFFIEHGNSLFNLNSKTTRLKGLKKLINKLRSKQTKYCLNDQYIEKVNSFFSNWEK